MFFLLTTTKRVLFMLTLEIARVDALSAVRQPVSPRPLI